MKINLTKTHWSLITITYMGLILWSSMRPASDSQHTSYALQVAHNLAHVPAYAILMFLLVSTIRSNSWKINAVLWAFFIAVSYGLINEIVQSFTPGRSCSAGDVVLNALGAGITLFLIRRKVSF